MLSQLRSIDNLLNRFDELSQCHTRLIEEFNQNYSNEEENPLKDVQRDQIQRDKTMENLLKHLREQEETDESSSPLDQFNRSIRKNSHLHRPPSYSSNRSNPFSSVSIPTDSAFETKKILLSTFRSISPATRQISRPPMEETSSNVSIRPPPSFSPSNSNSKSVERKPIRYFSIETAIRLSQPKKYSHLDIRKIPYRSLSSQRSKTVSSSSIKRSNSNSKEIRSKKLPNRFNCSSNRSVKPIESIPFEFPMPLKCSSKRFNDPSKKFSTKKSSKNSNKDKFHRI